jgi:uncharacterized protein
MSEHTLLDGDDHGEGGPLLPDCSEVEGFFAAAEAGDPNAQHNLGVLYMRGECVAKDPAQAATWFHRAAAQGDTVAQLNLGYLYGMGEGVPKDTVESARWYRAAAEGGHLGAQRQVGLYYTGDGVPKDWEEAVRWYTVAADRGHALAQFDLAFLCWRGRGVRWSPIRAMALAFRASPDPVEYRTVMALPNRRFAPVVIMLTVVLALLAGAVWWMR